MKIRSFLLKALLFVIVFFTFLLPPLIQKTTEILDFSSSRIFVSECIQTVCVFIILYFYRIISGKTNLFFDSKYINKCKDKKFRLFIYSGYMFLTFGVLCISSAILQGIAFFLQDVNNNNTNIISPKGIAWIYCILGFLFAAIYEECMYRVFVPESLYDFSYYLLDKCNKNNKKIAFIISEILSVFIFSFAHRYLGVFAVINAFLGYLILRFCYKKTGCIFINIFAHFLYNLLNLLLLI